jgi:putative methionine-R-sulfoxide reductase with GAF domain
METQIDRPRLEERIRTSLENLVFALGDIAGADRSSLFVVDEERSEMWLAVARTDGPPLDVRMPLGRGVAGLAWKRGEPIHVDDAYASRDFNRDVDAISGYRTRSLLCVPIRGAAGRVSAVLQLLNAVDRAGFSAADEAEIRDLEPELAALLAASGPSA